MTRLRLIVLVVTRSVRMPTPDPASLVLRAAVAVMAASFLGLLLRDARQSQSTGDKPTREPRA